jgi:hypothetical protein
MFYAVILGLNIVYAIAMLYFGEYAYAALNSGVAAAMIGIKQYG